MYMLQEQVSEFLAVKSFKRKYPDLERRDIDPKERNYLREKGVVSEIQVNLGLTALKTDEVLDLMAKDYPDKYKDYASVLHERERQSITNKHKEYEAPAVDAGKIKEYIKKAVKQASEFNMLFNRERKEERQAYYDMQTSIFQVPTGRMLKMPKEATKVGAYPVALIPGQFQEYYRKYSSDELNYFPINTAIYGPPLPPELIVGDGEDSEDSSVVDVPSVKDPNDSNSDSSSTGSGSTSSDSDSDMGQSSKQEAKKTTNGEYKPPESECKEDKVKKVSKLEAGKELEAEIKPGAENVETDTSKKEPKDIPDAVCGICLKGKDSSKKKFSEQLVHCSQCDNSGHPTCLQMNDSLVHVIKTYPWQCMECKTCTLCGDPTHEDKMMFCDDCDRGHHTFCVGLKSIPTGQWTCESCRKDISSTPTTTRSGRKTGRRK
ncbi:PHD finger protein 10-like [Saccoglossus kowalevskii]